ncbi:unnamed protein product [Hydatigera taeniaeformis]|uniref:histone acetyltransferase n=1 Tax=Hydatigena taeniaeformis TaxID=6205 RepID=A0A0R3XCX1_HYDTA|nr:unnamed protein product [Hydatigera taeniaeformis]
MTTSQAKLILLVAMFTPTLLIGDTQRKVGYPPHILTRFHMDHLFLTRLMSNADSTNRNSLQFQQQHLRLLLHANCCRQVRRLSQPCDFPNCSEGCDLLAHMEKCRRRKDCDTAYCTVSKNLITHWRKCTDEECIVCAPSRRLILLSM